MDVLRQRPLNYLPRSRFPLALSKSQGGVRVDAAMAAAFLRVGRTDGCAMIIRRGLRRSRTYSALPGLRIPGFARRVWSVGVAVSPVAPS